MFGFEHRTLGQIDAIRVDEIQYSKGHKYLTLGLSQSILILLMISSALSRTFPPILSKSDPGILS